jgi:hypothetical protein
MAGHGSGPESAAGVGDVLGGPDRAEHEDELGGDPAGR